ncbi:MAG: hypothetical protein J6P34_03505 [Paludibacteraceae bacterium]|nr:hypothetical protein [Paludibacteraceae bacterium]
MPLVRMLRDYGIDRFLKLLRSLGITTMNRDADHYGASLILGGAEATLQEICNMYGTLARAVLMDNRDIGHMSKRLHPRRRIAGGPIGSQTRMGGTKPHTMGLSLTM